VTTVLPSSSDSADSRPTKGASGYPYPTEQHTDEDYRIKSRRICQEEATKAAVRRGIAAAGRDHQPVRAYEQWAAANLPVEEQPLPDPVNHPTHYAQGWSRGAEVIDITENLNFNRGNAVKYLARAGAKDPARELEDLRKAAWYVAREIARLESQR
jgi:hypothetical protein